jgi:hypothetical protein
MDVRRSSLDGRPVAVPGAATRRSIDGGASMAAAAAAGVRRSSVDGGAPAAAAAAGASRHSVDGYGYASGASNIVAMQGGGSVILSGSNAMMMGGGLMPDPNRWGRCRPGACSLRSGRACRGALP